MLRKWFFGKFSGPEVKRWLSRQDEHRLWY
jgi:hypothetical protein